MEKTRFARVAVRSRPNSSNIGGDIIGREAYPPSGRRYQLRLPVRVRKDGFKVFPVKGIHLVIGLLERGDSFVIFPEGKLTADGRFDATKLMLKCPSKYEAKLEEDQTARSR